MAQYGEEMKQVQGESHPFVSKKQLPNFVGKPVAFVGKVSRIEGTEIYLKTADESVVKVIKFRGDSNQIEDGSFLEVRGIVNKDFSLIFG